jgi:hypothetical protein
MDINTLNQRLTHILLNSKFRIMSIGPNDIIEVKFIGFKIDETTRSEVARHLRAYNKKANDFYLP